MDLRSFNQRLARLLAARKQAEHAEAGPHTVVLLPNNSRGPAYAGPWPRVERTGRAVVITYLLEDGQPSGADIAAMVRA
ncbi:MAG: hypothetical protein WCG85_23085 [Polyangia bacterium]